MDLVIKKTFGYVETKQELIEAYKENIKFFAKEKLVYIDESGIEINAIKERVWSFKGSVLHAKKSGKYYQRYKRTSLEF